MAKYDERRWSILLTVLRVCNPESNKLAQRLQLHEFSAASSQTPPPHNERKRKRREGVGEEGEWLTRSPHTPSDGEREGGRGQGRGRAATSLSTHSPHSPHSSLPFAPSLSSQPKEQKQKVYVMCVGDRVCGWVQGRACLNTETMSAKRKSDGVWERVCS